ncbi:MAG: hypothetical protein RBS43_06990 [Candidatus Cloacimonas sp.]|jgi:hypothetical protein|nr:hypothetical protein [Candidatus Cloacimonas sp.]
MQKLNGQDEGANLHPGLTKNHTLGGVIMAGRDFITLIETLKPGLSFLAIMETKMQSCFFKHS